MQQGGSKRSQGKSNNAGDYQLSKGETAVKRGQVNRCQHCTGPEAAHQQAIAASPHAQPLRHQRQQGPQRASTTSEHENLLQCVEQH
ncbi:hypothetical protein D3C81_1353230 [compost metagenome]